MSAEFAIDPAAVRAWKRYPEYKDSGVEWLGEVPAGWEIKKLAWITKCLDKRRIPLNAEERGRIQDQFPYWGAAGVVDYIDKWLFDEPLVLLGEDGAPFFEPYKDVAFYVQGKIWVNNHAHVLRATKVDPRYLAYSLNAVDFLPYINGSTRDKLTQAEMNSIQIPYPIITEQHAIAAFLDRETARIDALIEKKQRFIGLLEEKRQALITQAVTKGLDPDVEMKDSGVEWLGEVPAGWDVTKLKYAVSIRNGQVNPEIEPYCQMVLVAPNHIESGTGKIIGLETASEQQAESGKYQFFIGDVLYCKIRPHLQKACLPEFNGICSADMYPLQPNSMICGKFLLYVLLSDYFTKYTVDESMRVAMPKINRVSLGNCFIAVPSPMEQSDIVSSIESQTEKIDLLLSKISSQIEKFHEYRTALISAAVTGKIDVRGEVPAAP